MLISDRVGFNLSRIATLNLGAGAMKGDAIYLILFT